MSLNTNSIDSNIWKLYVLRGLAFAWFPIPTIILFYQSHGLDLEQAILLKTILSLSILLGEVPSGYIADKLGRKFCLVTGSGVWIIGWLFYCGGNSFTIFALAEILTGIAGSLISGADTAIAYETLLQSGRASYYRTLEGRLVAIAGVSEAVCGIIGAAIAEINLVIPFYHQIPSSIRATVLSLNSFTFRLSFAVVAPILGAIASGYSLSVALFVGGWYFLVAGSLCWLFLVKLQVI